MSFIAIALSVSLNLNPFTVDSVRVSPQLVVDTPVMCYQNKSYAATFPLVTAICDREPDRIGLLKHENYHFWNHYGEYGIPFMLGYSVVPDQFEDYLGAKFTTVDHTPNYYLFGWDREAGWNLYQQLYFK